jgi:hypothetical protein
VLFILWGHSQSVFCKKRFFVLICRPASSVGRARDSSSQDRLFEPHVERTDFVFEKLSDYLSSMQMVYAGLELTSGMRLKVFLGGQTVPGHKAGEFAFNFFHSGIMKQRAGLAQLVAHETFNLGVMGSSPMLSVYLALRLAEIS